jgi:hypothetical protein
MRKCLAGLLLALVATSASALPVRIDFDDAPPFSIIDDRYADKGVTFVDVMTLPFITSNGIWNRYTGNNPRPETPVVALFSGAVSSVSLTGLDVGLDGFLLTAYDSLVGGQVVDSKKVFGTGVGQDQAFTLTVVGSDIRRIEFSQAGGFIEEGIVFDDLSFEPKASEIPEPGSVALFGLAAGLSAVARRRRL